ncbi:MAG: tRNA1(Val) (adenine(37)-N6)-methyltransferase [Desulfatitalea sp.]|nr:tRNA1(Val) (adenine(37)-N6)-methyltransferase [Desulfatitalea sp.]
MDDRSSDTFFNGRLIVHQLRNGYRFSIDAVLLAATITPRPGDRMLDLGTGCGVISLIVAFRHPTVQIHAVEIQESLADLARTNIAANHLDQRISLSQADMRHLPAGQVGAPFDWVVSNPPYRASCTGRVNPDNQKALARHEIMLDVTQLIATAKRMLRTGGRLATIFPAARAVDLLWQMRSAGLEPKWLQAVHSREGEEARLLMVHAIKAARPGLIWAPPLMVYGEDGGYTPAVQKMMTA